MAVVLFFGRFCLVFGFAFEGEEGVRREQKSTVKDAGNSAGKPYPCWCQKDGWG